MEQTGTVEKALDLLFHLHERGRAMGVTELARELGVPKSSIHRLLAALARRGLVERDGESRYRPGMGLVALGRGVLEREPLLPAARPALERLARDTGETAFLTVERSGRIVVLDKVEGDALLRVSPTVGSAVPVHATAVGKLQLAFAPDAVALSGRLEAFTARTTRTRSALAREAERARRRGWAENREEWLEGLVVVAAPVLADGRLEGCLVVAGPVSRLPASRTAAMAKRIRSAARETAARLDPGREAA